MNLLMNKSLLDSLVEDLKTCTFEVNFVAAFCKLETLKYLDNFIGKDIKKKLLIRFRLDDLLSGVTDIDLYDYCKNNNWEIFVNFDLHAKMYRIDDILYVGSANMTERGLGINEKSNIEGNVRFKIDVYEKNILQKLFLSSKKLDDDLYNKMKSSFDNVQYKSVKKETWNKSIVDDCKIDEILFQEDFPINESPLDLKVNEAYLGIKVNDDISAIRTKFENTKIMKWLISVIKEKESKEIYFGELSQIIHSIIFQEPKQYRKDVKRLQQILYRWLEELNYDFLQITLDEHTIKIKLII